jgi:hypothetical protein
MGDKTGKMKLREAVAYLGLDKWHCVVSQDGLDGKRGCVLMPVAEAMDRGEYIAARDAGHGDGTDMLMAKGFAVLPTGGLIYDVLKTSKPGDIVKLVTADSDIRLGIATFPVPGHMAEALKRLAARIGVTADVFPTMEAASWHA